MTQQHRLGVKATLQIHWIFSSILCLPAPQNGFVRVVESLTVRPNDERSQFRSMPSTIMDSVHHLTERNNWEKFNGNISKSSEYISVGPCVEIWAPVCTFW